MPKLKAKLLHPTTALSLERYLAKPAQSLILVGVASESQDSLVGSLSSTLLGVDVDKLGKHPFFTRIQKPNDRTEISIDQIRQLIKNLSLKSYGTSLVNRVVVITPADALNAESQNALLKIIEEPPINTVFILRVESLKNLLPTIISRSQLIKINSVFLKDAVGFFKDKYPSDQIESAWRLSGGHAELIGAILADSNHPIKESISLARTFLAAGYYKRLVIADNVSKEGNLIDLITGLERVFEALQRSPKNQAPSVASSILSNRQLLLELQEKVDHKANPRLIAMKLALNLRV